MGPDLRPHQLDGAAALTWAMLETPATCDQVVARDRPRWEEAGGSPTEQARDALERMRAGGFVVEAIEAGDS